MSRSADASLKVAEVGELHGLFQLVGKLLWAVEAVDVPENAVALLAIVFRRLLVAEDDELRAKKLGLVAGRSEE